MVTLIVAYDENRAIGDSDTNQMPWHFPKDLEHFREQTRGECVIMGRKTYESICEQNGGPLDNVGGRMFVILTSNPQQLSDEPPHVKVAISVEQAFNLAEHHFGRMTYVAGGAEVYKQTLPFAKSIIATEIHDTYEEGDVKFPEFDDSNWKRSIIDDSNENFTICKYTRKR